MAAVKHFRWSEPGHHQWFFTNHETRNTNHGLFIACFARQMVKNAGQSLLEIAEAPEGVAIRFSHLRLAFA